VPVYWSPEELKRSWGLKFRRSGGSGAHSGLIEDLDGFLREALGRLVPAGPDELQIAGGWTDDANWFAVTTARVVSSIDGQVGEAAIEEISDVIPVELRTFRKKKTEATKLVLALKDGGALTVVTEPGLPFVGFWNLLKRIPRHNLRK
jgi:hypothetical protein